MSSRRLAVMFATIGVVFSVGVGGSAAIAGPPEVVTFSETFHDDFLSDECGVDVTTTVSGTVRIREFDRTTGLVTVVTISAGLTASAGDNTFRFRNAGADVFLAGGEGVVHLVTGQVPFEFTGVLKLDEATGEVLLEPQHTIGTDRACASLTS